MWRVGLRVLAADREWSEREWKAILNKDDFENLSMSNYLNGGTTY